MAESLTMPDTLAEIFVKRQILLKNVERFDHERFGIPSFFDLAKFQYKYLTAFADPFSFIWPFIPRMPFAR